MSEFKSAFTDFGLKAPVLAALNDLGYKQPSPIQKECIPYLLEGRDVLGLAQTGSGKTATFSLPLLNNINITLQEPQILVLAPTRELAIQVAEAMALFSKYMHNVYVAALYGGQRYGSQLRVLRQGAQIVVGTPGRLLDHLKRGTLNLSNLKSLVLDEADEMLRMGFIEDVENILARIPKDHQTALFSATMPEAIFRISNRFMNNPQEIRIKSNINTQPDINQRYCIIHGIKKSEALLRFLETENFDAVIIFVKTKNLTLEVASELERNGYNSAALNGDMNQTLREQTLERLRNGDLDILIATDVAARGLDVQRISLVINYDIPTDYESYVHRIGRTGRAGRTGNALLFIDNRERRLLRYIERNINVKMQEVKLPTSTLLSQCRLDKFIIKIKKQLESNDLNQYCLLLDKIYSNLKTQKLDINTLGAALIKIAQGKHSLIIKPDPIRPAYKLNRNFNEKRNIYHYHKLNSNYNKKFNSNTHKMQLYRIEVGRNDGVEVRHIVGAIANEGNINSRYIGNIKLFASYSIIEMSLNVSNEVLNNFIHTKIMNKPINIKVISNSSTEYNILHKSLNYINSKRTIKKKIEHNKQNVQKYDSL